MRKRLAARVIAINEAGHVLLFRVVDPYDTNPPCWITPGGEIEADEAPHSAACRELFEETGHVVDADALIGPVAIAEGAWAFRGEPIYSVDTYFALRVDTFDAVPDNNLDPVELEILGQHRWWSPDELADCEDDVFPRELVPLIRDLHAGMEFAEPRQLPW